MTATLDVLRRRDFWVLAGGLAAVTVAAGLVTGLWFAAGARALLAVHFTRLPATLGEAAGIWLHNARSTLGVAVFALARPISRWLLDGARPVWDRALVDVLRRDRRRVGGRVLDRRGGAGGHLRHETARGVPA